MGMSGRFLRPRASGAFNPKSLSGLAAWYDAADATTLTIATGVSAWADKSGNGRTITQDVANNQPASGTRTIGGKNALDFDGSNDSLSTGFTIGDFTTSREFTAFVVKAADNTSATLMVSLWADRSLAGDASGFSIGRRTTRAEFILGSGILTSTGSAIAYRRLEDNTTAAVIYASSASASSGVFQAWRNNALQSLSLVSGTSLATSDFLSQGTANHRIVIGAGSFIGNSDALEWYHDGLIGEILVYSRALSSGQVAAVNRYLGTKWGITVA